MSDAVEDIINNMDIYPDLPALVEVVDRALVRVEKERGEGHECDESTDSPL